MIGTYKELLVYISLSAGWYKPLGFSEKTGWKTKRRILSGNVSEEFADKYLPMLGAHKVRGRITVPSLWERKGEIVTERIMVDVTCRRSKWYVGFFEADWANEIKKIRRKCSMNTLHELSKVQGFTLVHDRIVLPSIWELPTAIDDRAYTKQDLVASVSFHTEDDPEDD